MNIKENLQDYLRTGSFKSVQIGEQKATIIERLGPTAWSIQVSKQDNRISVLKYGITEFYFSEESGYTILEGIMLQPVVFPAQDLNFKLDAEWLTEDLLYKNVKEQLDAFEIDFVEKEDLYKNNVIETIGGVSFLFYDDDHLSINEWGLCKIVNWKH
ncbi:MAG: hypothetical protein AB8F95_02245 [Bacteroidia bacterium]